MLSIPIKAAYLGGISIETAAISGSAGIVELTVVLLFHPVERIHELIADFNQISIIINIHH